MLLLLYSQSLWESRQITQVGHVMARRHRSGTNGVNLSCVQVNVTFMKRRVLYLICSVDYWRVVDFGEWNQGNVPGHLRSKLVRGKSVCDYNDNNGSLISNHNFSQHRQQIFYIVNGSAVIFKSVGTLLKNDFAVVPVFSSTTENQ